MHHYGKYCASNPRQEKIEKSCVNITLAYVTNEPTGTTMNTQHLIKSSTLLALTALTALAVYANNATISTTTNQRCISSNGLPDHDTGRFPNSGNPHTISEQNINYCFPLNPTKGNTAKMQRGSIGVALNGVTIRPGTADYWDDSSPRGHSRDRSSGWNLEGMGSSDKLGIDTNNAHVDNRGLYHYHGVAEALVASTSDQGSIIGYAADGFEIHYVPGQTSSYQLKSGTRASGPGGKYDGSYVEDWEYVAGSGTLDKCNGGELDGKFVYFATETYPFFPRCLWGKASSDFGLNGGDNNVNNRDKPSNNFRNANGSKLQRPTNNDQGQRRGPPAEALAACQGLSTGDSCSFSARGHSISGSCRVIRNGDTACAPQHRH